MITPDEGRCLCNGSTYSRLVYLAANASTDEWWEVDSIPEESEPEELTAEEALDIILGGDSE